MGSASSKPARHLPRTAKPTWAGARTLNPGEAPHARPSIPRASETKNEAIERDARDPQFMANLSKLGQVRVDHHMQTVRPDAERIQGVFQTRLQSEVEASSARSTHNKLVAGSLQDLLQERKSLTSRDELHKLAQRYDVDPDKLESITRFVNSPSIDEGSIKRTIGEDGAETVTMKAIWVETSLRQPPSAQLTSG